MNWRSTAGKSALAKMLMKEHGFSKRKSERAVNAVFNCMARALRCGDIVELPIGWMHTAVLPAKRAKRKFQRFRDIQTGETSLRLVTYPDKIIRFRANPRLIKKGPFPPPPELGQLLSRLGFPDVTAQDVKSLLAASVDPNKSCAAADLPGYMDRLLDRLRELVREERQFSNFLVLLATVRQLYEIR